MTLERWNQRYRSAEPLDRRPAPLLVQTASAMRPGDALDLACGAGRNASWLASAGWHVVAVDGAEEAIRLVQAEALEVETRLLDLEGDAPLPFADGVFDLVAVLYFLHRPLFAEVQRVLRPGGVVVTAVRTRGIAARFCLPLEELRAHFDGWPVLHESDGDVAELVARKPSEQ